MIRENLNPDVDIEGILPTLVDTRTVHAKEAIEMLEENFGDRVFASRISKTVRFAEAPVKGMSVLKYDPDGTAAHAYRQLAKEVLEWQAVSERACARARWPPSSARPTSEDRPGEEDAAEQRRRAGRPPRRRRPPSTRPSAPRRSCAGDAARPSRTTSPRIPPRRRSACATRSPPTSRRTCSSAPRRPRARSLRPDVGRRTYAGRRAASARPMLRVVGVGGAGVNAVNRMVEAEVDGRRVHRDQHRPAVAAAVRRRT